MQLNSHSGTVEAKAFLKERKMQSVSRQNFSILVVQLARQLDSIQLESFQNIKMTSLKCYSPIDQREL